MVIAPLSPGKFQDTYFRAPNCPDYYLLLFYHRFFCGGNKEQRAVGLLLRNFGAVCTILVSIG